MGAIKYTDREKVIYDIERCIQVQVPDTCRDCSHYGIDCMDKLLAEALELLKEQKEEIKTAYERGYKNGRSDEAGLRDGTIMQTFNPD